MATASSPPLVVCDQLTVSRRRRTVLHGIDLELRAGVVAIAGANGSGKSTLLDAVAGLLACRGGRLTVAGNDITTRAGHRSARGSFAYLPQHADFPARFTVAAAVTYGAWLQRVDDAPAAVAAAMDQVGLRDHAGDRLSTLSGGMRQRALLAQAIVHQPPVLLLDEPTVGLDAEHRHQLRSFLERHADHGRLVVLSTHLADDLHLAGRIVVLNEGRIAFDGAPEALAGLGDGPTPLETALRTLDRPAAADR